MYIRFFGLFALVSTVAVIGSAQQPQQSPRSSVRKERTHDVPTPGRLGGLRTEAAPRLSVDATGETLYTPDVWQIDPVSGAEFRRDEVLVRFKEGVDSIGEARTLRAMRATRILHTLPENWKLVELESGAVAAETVRTLRDMPEVQEASLNYRVRQLQFRPNDEFYRLQWNLDAINMPAAWQINPGARNDVIVAVIDSGLNVTTDTFTVPTPIGQIPVRFAQVPDLVTNERLERPFDFVYQDDQPLDLDGHGTHVAGTIAQQTNNSLGVAGVAFNVKLMPLKVLADDDSWDDVFFPGNRGGSVAIIAEAIRYAADNNAKIINLSLGGEGEAPPLRDAIMYAVSKGAFVVMAAGNSGDEGNPRFFPAGYAPEINGAMAVGAVTRGLRHADYSSFHPYVEICAPGGELASLFDYEGGVTQVTYSDDATLTFLTGPQKVAALRLGFRPRFDVFELVPSMGTSMAAPHVAGVAALLYSQGVRNPRAIEEAIKRFARSIDATQDECGAGLVDARRALRGLGLAR